MKEDGTLTCGHSRALGRPGPYPPEWYCDYCALHVTVALDQEIAAARDAAQARGEAWE